MKQRAVAIVAEYLSHRRLGRVVGLKPIADDDYVMAIEDLRDGRVHLMRSARDLEPWIKSFTAGECVQPAFGLCSRCRGIHADHDVDGEVFRTCIHCQLELVEVVLELNSEQEAEGNPPSVGPCGLRPGRRSELHVIGSSPGVRSGPIKGFSTPGKRKREGSRAVRC